MRLKDKVAIVTGASYGIGFQVAKELSEDDWEVYGIARSRPKSDFSFNFVKFDLSQLDRLNSLVGVLPKKINILINNAGINYKKKLKDVTLTDFHKIIGLNLGSPILLTKMLLPRMSRGSRIINISSLLSVEGNNEMGFYCASKAGIDRFTTTLALEHKDLKVVGILPAAVDTPQMRSLWGDDYEYNKILKVEDISRVVMEVVKGGFNSGDLIVVTNDWMSKWWKEKDKYKIVNLDQR